MLGCLWDTGRRTGIVSNGQTHIQLRSLLALNLDRLVETYLISKATLPDAAARTNDSFGELRSVNFAIVTSSLSTETCLWSWS